MKYVGSLAITAALTLTPAAAGAADFAAGSLIVPMDVDYQDMGMLRAYGLVYELLRQNVPVRWVIASRWKLPPSVTGWKAGSRRP